MPCLSFHKFSLWCHFEAWFNRLDHRYPTHLTNCTLNPVCCKSMPDAVECMPRARHFSKHFACNVTCSLHSDCWFTSCVAWVKFISFSEEAWTTKTVFAHSLEAGIRNQGVVRAVLTRKALQRVLPGFVVTSGGCWQPVVPLSLLTHLSKSPPAPSHGLLPCVCLCVILSSKDPSHWI